MAPGDSRYDPDEEEFILQEESLHHTSGSRFTRVLSNFVFFEGGRPADMDSCMSLARPSPNLEVVGIAATISGREGLFAQCGWFGDTDVEWIWTRLSKFLSLEVRQDIRFRGGHPCVWLATKLGDYALVLPHTIYIDQWEQSLSLMQPTGLTAKLGMWPTGGTRPFWWEDRWKEDWPFDKATRSKRRASKDLEEVSPYGVETDSRVRALGNGLSISSCHEPRLAEPTSIARLLDIFTFFIMSNFYELEIPQFEPLAENGENYVTWRQTMLTTLDILDLGHFVATGMKGTAREDVLASREVRSHLTPALITYAIEFPTTPHLWTALATRFALGAPEAQPHDQPRHRTAEHTKEGGNGQGVPDGQGDGQGKGRERRRGRKPATSSIQIAPADANSDVHEPRAIVGMVHDELERNEGGARTYKTPTTPGVVHTSLGGPPTHLDASDAFSSHRITKQRDPELTTLDKAGPDPFKVGEGDIRQKSTSRDGPFDEGETAHQGVEASSSQQPVNEDVVRIRRNEGEATKTNVPGRLELPARPPEVGKASGAFERQTTPQPYRYVYPRLQRRPRHVLERDDDPSGGVCDAYDVPTPLLTTHNARSAPQSAPEWVNTTPSMRTRALIVFDDGGEVCFWHKVIEDQDILVAGAFVSTARNDGDDARTRAPSRTTSPTLSDPAHANPIGTPGDRIAPSTRPKCAAASSLVLLVPCKRTTPERIGGANVASSKGEGRSLLSSDSTSSCESDSDSSSGSESEPESGARPGPFEVDVILSSSAPRKAKSVHNCRFRLTQKSNCIDGIPSYIKESKKGKEPKAGKKLKAGKGKERVEELEEVEEGSSQVPFDTSNVKKKKINCHYDGK
ncbi:hypothetical protein BDV93DRAFT_569928 [Ceratobasidium sp. AG-I]|nr:hypothetical protein BDV93DRAFT_569928 [Ceratobasidium sp. AG-I]